MKYKIHYLIALILLITSIPIATAQSSCSQNGSGVEMYLSVPNLTDQRLSVYWVDQQCNEQLIAAVKSGSVFYQTTYDGHEWIFRDASGNTVKEVTASVSSPMVPVGVTSYNPEPVTSNCSNSGSSEKIDLTVINNTQEPVLLFWIDFNCIEQLYEIVAGQDQFVQETFLGHDWVVRHPGGNLGKHIAVSTAENIVVIDPPVGGSTTSPAVTPATTAGSFPITESECEVQPVTPEMGLEDFYAKYCDYMGLIIASSDLTEDAALEQAWLIAANVLYTRPDVVESLVKMNFKIVVLSVIEFNTDVPELAFMADDPDQDIDDFRAYAKVLEEPRLVTIPQENLLCSIGDTSAGQSLFVDTLANLTRFALVRDLEPDMGDKVEAVRQNALTNGIWDGSWVTESNQFYWNYGVQTYFNASFDALLTGATDDYTNTRDELASYDPQLYTLIDDVFGAEDWTPECPTE